MTTRFDAWFGSGCRMVFGARQVRWPRLGPLLLAGAAVWFFQAAPARGQSCAGDCNADGQVVITELLKCVNIALELAPMSDCVPADANDSSDVTIDEIIAAVNAALVGCVGRGSLSVDKIALAAFLGGKETVAVTAKDENWQDDNWTVTSSDTGIVDAERDGGQVDISGVGLGDATITLTTNSGNRRTLPVKVYDHKVLDYGEILVRYVDAFECDWNTYFLNGHNGASFYNPVVPDGWHALGSLGVSRAGCEDVNGQSWMIVVKADEVDADPNFPPLMTPTGYEEEWAWRYCFVGICNSGRFWTPICPGNPASSEDKEHYVAMGTVVTGTGWYRPTPYSDPGEPSLDAVTCVRKDLTQAGVAGQFVWNDSGTGGSVPFQGSWQLEAPNNETSTIYLGAGTFVTQGEFRSCSDDCWTPPEEGSHTVMHVLALKPPLLIDAENSRRLPDSLRSCIEEDNPPALSEPAMTKTMLMPFTALRAPESSESCEEPGSVCNDMDIGWMVNNSPFVRVERTVRWERVAFNENPTSIDEKEFATSTWTKGIETAESTKYWEKTGVSLTGSGGIQFKGINLGVSATVSKEFGYETQTGVSNLESKNETVHLFGVAYGATAVHRDQSLFRVQLHHPATKELETIQDKLSYESLAPVYRAYRPCYEE